MPVSPRAAYGLLAAFGMLEFTLKGTPGYLAADHGPLIEGAGAKANWQAVDLSIAALPLHVFRDRVSLPTLNKLLGPPRNRPMVQEVTMERGVWRPIYRSRALPPNEAVALVVAMRRVRNNLFHGGKEDPLQEPYEGDDEEWADAAREIAELLLDLLDRHQLRPV